LQFRDHTLDNGLRIIAECNPQAYSTAIGFFVNTGARDEQSSVFGVSHFLEHMVFKGTPNRSAADVNRELDEIGSHSNAFTSEEHTVYYAAVVPEYQTHVVDLIADILRPSLREEDFETEKKVIIEEILKYDDQPPFGAHEKCMADYFGQHPLGHNVLGTVDSVTALTEKQMRDYFQRRYSPENIVLAAAGNVEFKQLVHDANECCGSWEPFATQRVMQPPAPNATAHVIHRDNVAQQYVVQISGAPSATDADRFAQRLLAAMFGDDTGSRLYWALIDRGLAEYAATCTYEFQDCGITMTFLSCAPDATADNLEVLHQLQLQIGDSGVTEDELQLAKSKVCSQIVRRSERPMSRLFSVGNNWLQRGEYRTVAEAVSNYQAVTVDDIARLASKFPFHENAMVAAGPLANIPELHSA
jgi:predicted Zn-dependent peptidase